MLNGTEQTSDALRRGDNAAGDEGGREVTTRCPHCGEPIGWLVRQDGRHRMQEIAAWPCPCTLTDDEWLDLADDVARALDAAG